MKNNKFSKIESIIQAAKKKSMYILVDDENEFIKTLSRLIYGNTNCVKEIYHN